MNPSQAGGHEGRPAKGLLNFVDVEASRCAGLILFDFALQHYLGVLCNEDALCCL